MEIIIIVVGFIVVMLYLLHLDKKTTKIAELLLMKEQTKKNYMEKAKSQKPNIKDILRKAKLTPEEDAEVRKSLEETVR